MKHKASTLIEILFYFAILGVVMLVAMNLAIQVLSVKGLSNNIHELQSNVETVEGRLAYAIQTADSVDDGNSLFDDDQGKLALKMSSGGDLLFYIDSGKVYMRENSAPPTQLSTDAVEFGKLRFEKISVNKAPDQIRISSEALPANKDLSNLNVSFQINVSISLRK